MFKEMPGGFAEDHFSIDTLVALYYDLAGEEQAESMRALIKEPWQCKRRR